MRKTEDDGEMRGKKHFNKFGIGFGGLEFNLVIDLEYPFLNLVGQSYTTKIISPNNLTLMPIINRHLN